MGVLTIPQPEIGANADQRRRLANGLLPEDSLYEVVDGQRVELPLTGFYPSWIASQLCTFLATFVHPRERGWVICHPLLILDSGRDLRRRPDVAFVSDRTWPRNRPLPCEGDWEVVPDLAVEVISPNHLAEPIFAKIAEYFSYGVEQVWMILTQLSMVYIYDSPTRVRILTADDELVDTVVSGFRLPLCDLFTR